MAVSNKRAVADVGASNKQPTMRISFALLLICCCSTGIAQEYAGFRTSNYTGVQGAFFNPASLAGSKYRFDVNLFSISSMVGNNNAAFNLRDMTALENDYIEDKFFGEDAKNSSGIVDLDIHGPSGMFNVKKFTIGITTRLRTMANIRDIDGKLVNKLTTDFESDPELPYSVNSSDNMRMAVNGWAEIGITAAREILHSGSHHVKGGITLKYLRGAANGYLHIDRFNGTLSEDELAQDVYLSNTTGTIGMGFSGSSVSDVEIGKLLKNQGSGFGAELGLIYEFRPDPLSSEYKIRAGIALQDIGSIRYTRDPQRSGSYNVNITGAERFYLNELDGMEIDNYAAYFDAHPDYFTPAAANADREYNVMLPARMQLDLDYAFNSKFFLNLAGQVPLSGSENKPYNNQYYSGITLTPRFETRRIGAFLPLNYNGLTAFNAGVALRVGPVFLGSGSVISALVDESKQADFFIGFRFGGLK